MNDDKINDDGQSNNCLVKIQDNLPTTFFVFDEYTALLGYHHSP